MSILYIAHSPQAIGLKWYLSTWYILHDLQLITKQRANETKNPQNVSSHLQFLYINIARAATVANSTMIMTSTAAIDAMNQIGMGSGGLVSAILLSHCQLAIVFKCGVVSSNLSNLWKI